MAKATVRKATGKGYKPIKVSDNYTIKANSVDKIHRDLRRYQNQRNRMIKAVQKEYPGVSIQEMEDANIIPPELHYKELVYGRKVFKEVPPAEGGVYTRTKGGPKYGVYETVGGIKSKRDLDKLYKDLQFPLSKGYLKKRQASASNAIIEALTRSTAASDEELSALEKVMGKMDAMQLAGWRLQHPDLIRDVFDWYLLHRDMITEDAETVRLRTRILDSFGITYKIDRDVAGDKFIVPGSVKVAPKQTKITDTKPKAKKR